MGDARSATPDGSDRGRQKLVVGLLAAPGLARDLADELAAFLPARLRQRFPEFEWHAEAHTEMLVGAGAGMGADLVQVARERMLHEGWQFALCLTDLPLHVGRRPVTAHLSITLGVGVMSVPALGAVDLRDRVAEAALRMIERLLTGTRDQGGRAGRRPSRMPARLRARVRELEELSSPVGRAYAQDAETVRFVTAAGRGNLRLLMGMVRANRPWRLIAGLSRALVGALGAGAFGLTSPAMWQIADGMGVARMLLLAFGSLVAISGTLIIAHGLWERSPSPEARERVVLMNLATFLTIAQGVLTLYVALLIITGVCGTTLIPSIVLYKQLHHPVGLGDYLRVACAVSSLATIGGALGAALESDHAVREAAYGYLPSERSEAGQRDAGDR
ncbi:MAG: hypothetical protein JWN52_2688 [Actinomycetia bacterium]|nr:hypothetical protein [Actinomycetes bacterium]